MLIDAYNCSLLAGILVIVKNYTGDRVNFGIAIERAKALGLRCGMVIASDDCALTSDDRSAGRRGLCGALFVAKVGLTLHTTVMLVYFMSETLVIEYKAAVIDDD